MMDGSSKENTFLKSGAILLVEDDEPVRRVITAMLEYAGHTVTACATPLEALSVCNVPERTFDLILTDVVMPGMSGKVMADQITKERPAIKVLFMSGYAAEIVNRNAVHTDGMQFIQKPLRPSELNNRIHTLLAV